MGAKSNSWGKSFEQIFLKMARMQGVAVTRIPDGCRQLGNNRLIRVRSPFDWIVSYQNKTALLDTKTVDRDVFYGSECTEHQLSELSQHERLGAITGYVIWLRKVNSVVFAPTHLLNQAFQEGSKLTRDNPYLVYLGTINFDVRLIFQIGMHS